MLDYQYAYSLWVLLFLVIWMILYLARKDVRQEMVIVSLMFGFAGVVTELVHVRDWWQPLTLTHTSIGIEDFLIGFFIGGVASVIYEELFKKKLKIKKLSKKQDEIETFRFGIMLTILTIIFFFSVLVLNLHSFFALIISLSIAL
ncbi:MAG: hypothetical protein WCK29_01990, partial [archaeon]